MIDGVLILDKPAGVTSHDVVDSVRKVLGTKKVGHLGTLDPAATGVLPLVVGKTTRLARYLPSEPKEYRGAIRLGWETTTGDAEGTALAEPTVVEVARDRVVEAMASLEGRLLQVPPAYSAKKSRGVPSYKLARRGIVRDLEPVEIEVERFELLSFDTPEITFRIVCSAGTYVRSVARDLGRNLGTGGHLASLRRTRSGVFRIEDARPPDRISEADLISPGTLMERAPSLVVDQEDERRVGHGQQLAYPSEAPTLCIFNKKGDLIAIARAEKGWARPKVVLI